MLEKGQGYKQFGLHYGKFVRVNESVMLVDELRNKYPIESVMFLNRYFNPQEGDIEYPRVWEGITETFKDTTGKTAEKEGDVVVFAFAGGRVTYPVVLGSISQSNLFGDRYREEFGDFLTMQEARHLIKENIKRKTEYTEDNAGNIEKTITTYEEVASESDANKKPDDRERGTIHYSITKEGEVTLDITEVAEKTGTGNITLNLRGNDGQTNGNMTLKFNGKLRLLNTDDEGLENGNKIEIDNTDGDEKIKLEDKHGNKYNSTKDGMSFTDKNGNTYVNDANGIKITDKNGNVIEMKGTDMACLPATMLKLGKAAAIAINNLPACLFTGAPHSTSTDVQA